MKIRLLLAFFLAAACLGCKCTADNPAVGSVKPVQNQVWKGLDITKLTLLSDKQDLFTGETLKINNGGEALVDFHNQMILHLYNNSTTNLITATADPSVPLDVRMRLVEGGLVGVLNPGGGQAAFETPGGGTVYVTGTHFFIYYGNADQYLLAGNYDGSMTLSQSGESSISGGRVIPKGTYILYQPGKDVIQMDIPMDLSSESMMKNSSVDGMNRTASGLIDRALASPPEFRLTLESIKPDMLYSGDCPNYPNTAQIIVNAYAPDGIERVWIEWSVYDQKGEASMDQMATDIFVGSIGPASQGGTLTFYIFAMDKTGKTAMIGPFTIEVQICIG